MPSRSAKTVRKRTDLCVVANSDGAREVVVANLDGRDDGVVHDAGVVTDLDGSVLT